jgi:hypothetical protein
MPQIADPVIIAFAQPQLSIALIEKPITKPNAPFKGIVKGRSGRAWSAEANTECRLQGGAKSFGLQRRRHLAIFWNKGVDFQGLYFRPDEKNSQSMRAKTWSISLVSAFRDLESPGNSNCLIPPAVSNCQYVARDLPHG